MKHLHYLLQSTTDATTCALLVVAVGTSKADQHAHAELAARALVDDSLYYCVKDETSQVFVERLLEQNPDREIYRVTPRQALRFIENRAIADYVKNLSYAFRALSSMTKRKTHNNETK
mgnify:FL=1